MNEAIPTILIVEDEQEIGDLLLDLFKSEGYRAECVRTGRDALSVMDRQAIDLALVDLRLPGDLQGGDVAAVAAKRGIPVIIITGAAKEPKQGKLPFRILTKPFRVATAQALVAETLAKARRRQ